MAISLKEKYEEYKKYGNIIVDYDEILSFYPDYYKTKIELENTKFISKEEVDKNFEENYKTSGLYMKLTELAMAEDEIYAFMKYNKDFKYNNLKSIFEKLVSSCIKLCELIDYIGHYPTTYPVPSEEEKNPEMEELLERYDIIVRYHLNDDLDKMQITSSDVVRIIEKLKTNLQNIQTLKDKMSDGNWMFRRKISEEKSIEITSQILSEIENFPLSDYQENGKSKREEGKMYLRLQHGKNII